MKQQSTESDQALVDVDRSSSSDSAVTIKIQIFRFISEAKEPCNAKYIAQSLGLEEATVRGRLNELYHEGRIYKHARGFYSIKPSHGLGLDVGVGGGSGGLRVQNLVVVAPAVVHEHDELCLDLPSIGEDKFGKVKIGIVFGAKRNKISWTLAAPLGVDVLALRLCRAWVESTCNAKGYVGLNWVVNSVEVFNDIPHVRLDGYSAITLDSLDSTLVKIYQKEHGVRYEVKTSRSITLEELFYLLSGGAVSYITARDVHRLEELLSELVTAFKFQNRRLNDLVFNLEKFFKRVGANDGSSKVLKSSSSAEGFQSAALIIDGAEATTAEFMSPSAEDTVASENEEAGGENQ